MLPAELAVRFQDPAQIRAGGMGLVYSALDRESGRGVVLRVLDAVLCLEPEMRERFLDEARIAARVKHPNLVAVLASGETADGTLWVAAELVDGASLEKILDREKQLPAPKVIGLGRALLAGLAALHGAGIVHRDLKPANVMLDRTGTLKIVDFGIARDTAERLARARGAAIRGALHYLAPEQLENGRIAPATDVYAAGAILYHALAGRPPFPGDDPTAVAAARLTGQPAALETVVSEVPRALARVVHGMLSRDPRERYADGRVALSALKTASGDRSEAVRTLEAAGATDPGESLVPMRHTAPKVPIMPPASEASPFGPPGRNKNRGRPAPPPPRPPAPSPARPPAPPSPPLADPEPPAPQPPSSQTPVPSFSAGDAHARLAIAFCLSLILVSTLLALLVRWLR